MQKNLDKIPPVLALVAILYLCWPFISSRMGMTQTKKATKSLVPPESVHSARRPVERRDPLSPGHPNR